MTSHPTLKWILTVARYALLAAAVVYLVYNVAWYDTVTLDSDERVRLLEDRRDVGEIVILRDGTPETLPFERVKRDENDESVPLVHLGIVSATRGLDVGWVLLALIVYLPAPLIQAWRLVWMLAVQRERLGLWVATKLTFVGNFFNFALPGSTGGDLIKAYYLAQHTHHKTEAVTTVFLDRVVGMLGLISIASLMMMLASREVQLDNYGIVVGGILLAVAIGAVVIFHPGVQRRLSIRELIERLPAGEHLVRVGRATIAMRDHKGKVVFSLGLTIFMQLLIFAAAFCLARALDMEGGALRYFLFVPIGFLIMAIPITPGGLGVMEAAFIQFFTGAALPGNDPSQAVALALLIRLMMLVVALPGALVPLLGAHVPRHAELEAFEHEAEAPLAEAVEADRVDDDPTPAPPAVQD